MITKHFTPISTFVVTMATFIGGWVWLDDRYVHAADVKQLERHYKLQIQQNHNNIMLLLWSMRMEGIQDRITELGCDSRQCSEKEQRQFDRKMADLANARKQVQSWATNPR